MLNWETENCYSSSFLSHQEWMQSLHTCPVLSKSSSSSSSWNKRSKERGTNGRTHRNSSLNKKKLESKRDRILLQWQWSRGKKGGKEIKELPAGIVRSSFRFVSLTRQLSIRSSEQGLAEKDMVLRWGESWWQQGLHFLPTVARNNG